MKRIAIGGIALVSLALAGCGPTAIQAEDKPKVKFAENREKSDKPEEAKMAKFDGDRAAQYCKDLCDIGPRISGSDGMKKQQDLITKHFEGCGATVAKQEFKATQLKQKEVGMTNLIVSWNPERKTRILLCSHYDTRPQPDQEPNKNNWNKPFLSANDGTSGVAFLMELAHQIKDFPTEVGVDFAIFDGEEYVFSGPDGNDKFFFGSEHFASEYKKAEKTRKFKYKAALLFDLFAHDGAKLRIEDHSWIGARNLVDEVWGIAAKLEAKSFEYGRGFKRSLSVSKLRRSRMNRTWSRQISRK